MSIVPGTLFGPYEVTAVLGRGGMGEVYRARDGRLNRDVALKVLPPTLTADHERLLRFKREAQVLASLNHHNIAAIYGLEESRAARGEAAVEALVLELVEGPTLADRIDKGPLPLDEAREIGMQIAAALEAAHERGIIHRDLKPANVKIRPDGTVKVLDFGLAKAWEPSSGGETDVSASPTMTSPAMTRAGIILGTAAYMSPEQARGVPVDKRTDVWAFGCLLFEMLAGRHPLEPVGNVSDAIAAVLKTEPDWQTLPETTPPHIRTLLKRCLEKDPRRRLRDIGDAGLMLAEPSMTSETTSVTPAVMSSVRARWIAWTAVTGWLIAVAATVAWFQISGRTQSESPPPAPSLRLALPLASEAVAATSNSLQSFAISDDGTRLIFAGRDGSGSWLYLQDLVSGELKRLPETAGAFDQAFSPDGRAVGFTAGSAIKILRLDGGLPRDVARADTGREQWAWSDSDHIVVASPAGLSRISVNGGSPETVATLNADEALFSAVVPLPGGAYLVSVRGTTGTDDRSRIVVVEPGKSERLVVSERGGSPAFIPSTRSGVGHIVFGEAGRLMAVPFDAMRREVKGGAVPIVENVEMRTNGDVADYTVSSTGTLVYREGSLHELVFVDRATGAVRPLSANVRKFAVPRLSPDGSRVAMEIQDLPHQVWVLDIERDVLAPLTTEPTGSHSFAWAPDGQSIAYTVHLTPPQVGWIRANGSGSTEKFAVTSDSRVFVEHWSRDGRLALTFETPPTVVVLPLVGTAPPRPAGQPTKVARGVTPRFSPDGSWIAYADTAESGNPGNVFIQHLESGSRYRVSIEGGSDPLWAASGRELFFRQGRRVMATALTIAGASARIARPSTLFEGDYLNLGYDVTSDASRFVMVRTANTNSRALSVRLNWHTELERLVPIPR